jgi:hypothetical protein
MAQEMENHEETDQPDIRALRKAAEAGKKAQDELTQMKRELLFAKAGIDTASKIGGLLFKTWEGEDIDSLKAEAMDLGIVGNTGQQSATEVPAEEREQQNFRQAFNRGQAAAATDLPEQDPYDEAYQLFHDARKRGTTMDDAGLAAIDRILVAAASGDKRAIFNPNDWATERNQVGHRFDR